MLLNESFGDCHQLTSNPILVSGFFVALLSFANEFEQGSLEQLTFQNARINFLKDNGILYVTIFDRSDRVSTIKSNFKKIVKIFNENYKSILDNFSGEITSFISFRLSLLELEITQINCHENSNCNECHKKNEENPIFKEILERKK